MNFYSPAGRAKSCKRDNHPPLCTKRRATSCGNLSKILEKKNEKPGIQIQMSKLSKCSEAFWYIYIYIYIYIRIMLLREQHSMFRRTIFRYMWYFWCPTNTRIDALHKATIDGYRNIDGETSHCLNPGSVWQDSNCSTKIHQKADWRRNRSPQELGTFGQKNGQECRNTLITKPYINGREKDPNWTPRDGNEAFTLFQTMILMMRKSWTTQRLESFSDALQSHQTSTPNGSSLGATMGNWLVNNW